MGDTDGDLGDYEHSDYILNFGCNWAETHQGHIPTASRIMRAREQGRAKIVTFETRLSNSAALSPCRKKASTDAAAHDAPVYPIKRRPCN